MKKTPDQNSTLFKSRGKNPRCLMAYTLNNEQPVICTIVSDQPYFYMEDEEAAYADEEYLGDLNLSAIEDDLAELSRKMEAYDRLAKSYQHEPDRRLAEFAAEAAELAARKQTTASTVKVADKILAVLSQSRMAQSLIDFALAHNVQIAESDQVGTARYDRVAGKILIQSTLGEAEQCLLAVRELRRHWQHRKGVLLHPLTFHPEHGILINRAQVADLSIAMVRAAWELQLAGQRDLWEYIENSSMADLGRAFAREAFTDFRSLASGKASSAVFETWFLSERCRHQDKKLIQAMLADHQGYVFASEEASRTVSIELITALGEQPFGKNYLAPYAAMILEDPVFTEVRDRSNANFLWFIKFERSFRETEQALQSADGLKASDILSESASTQEPFEHEPQSIIIPMPGRGFIHNSHVKKRNGKLEASVGSTNVIHIRFGTGETA
jgi:hypothetical protein